MVSLFLFDCPSAKADGKGLAPLYSKPSLSFAVGFNRRHEVTIYLTSTSFTLAEIPLSPNASIEK